MFSWFMSKIRESTMHPQTPLKVLSQLNGTAPRASLLGLPVELQDPIIDELDFPDTLNLRNSCQHLHTIVPWSHQRMLEMETTQFFTERNLFTCRSCMSFLPASKFADNMTRGPRRKHGMKADRRFCYDCGVSKPGHYSPGSIITIRRLPFIHCLQCKGLKVATLASARISNNEPYVAECRITCRPKLPESRLCNDCNAEQLDHANRCFFLSLFADTGVKVAPKVPFNFWSSMSPQAPSQQYNDCNAERLDRANRCFLLSLFADTTVTATSNVPSNLWTSMSSPSPSNLSTAADGKQELIKLQDREKDQVSEAAVQGQRCEEAEPSDEVQAHDRNGMSRMSRPSELRQSTEHPDLRG